MQTWHHVIDTSRSGRTMRKYSSIEGATLYRDSLNTPADPTRYQIETCQIGVQQDLFAIMADGEYQSRIDAARVTAEWRNKRSNVPSDSLMDSPLFGGPRQHSLISLLESDREEY